MTPAVFSASLSAVRLRVGLLLLIAALLCLLPAWAQPLQPVPPLTDRVIDTTGVLQPDQAAALKQKLAALEQDTGAQVVVLMVPSTQPEDIAAYAHRVASDWKIGRKDVGDGLLLVVARNDRRVRIEVARTLEGAVPDVAAGRIIRESIAPHFKAGDFAGGLAAAVDRLSALIRNEDLPPVANSAQASASSIDESTLDLVWFALITIAFLGTALRTAIGRVPSALVTGAASGMLVWWLLSSVALALVAAVLAAIIGIVMGNIQHAPTVVQRPRQQGKRGRGHDDSGFGGFGGGFGGGSGGSFGGGFGSGGGGSFGGGGASGGW